MTKNTGALLYHVMKQRRFLKVPFGRLSNTEVVPSLDTMITVMCR
jgi:hypothetical protein